MVAKFITGLIFVFYSLISASQSTGKSYQFNKLDIHNGLSNNQIECIFKDSKGFMWFGTTSGLNRYDGYQFKVFKHDANDSSSINNDYVLSIQEMPDGKLLVETRDWLNVYDPNTERFGHNLPNYFQQFNLPTAKVLNVQKNSKGDSYYLMENNGLYKYVAATKKAGPIVLQGTNQQQITSFSLDSKGNIWLIRNNGLLQNADGNNGNIIFSSDAVLKYSHQALLPYRVFVDAQDELWINANGESWGVAHFEPVTNKFTPINKNTGACRLNNDLVFSVLQDNHSNIWLNTDHGGINIIDKKNGSVQYLLNNADDNTSLSQNSIPFTYKDDLGIIWVGTYKHGLNYYHENITKFRLYNHQPSNANSLSYGDVNIFAEDAKGNLWIGTNGGGIIYFNRQANTFQQIKHQANNSNSLSNDIIVSLCIDKQQRLWIGTYFGGLDCFDGKTFKHYTHNNSDTNTIADNRIYEIFEDSSNDLWVGTFSGGLDRLDRSTDIFHHNSIQSHAISSNYISHVREDDTHHLYIGTSNGLEILDKRKNQFKHYDISSSPSGNNIISICIAADNKVWIGSREGLFLFNPNIKKQLHFGVKDGLPDNAVLDILEDANHHLWASTLNGIADISIIGNVADNINIHSVNFDETDGLQGKEFNQNAAFKTSKGEIVFGGSNGFNLFLPNTIVPIKHKPVVYFTDFLLFNKSVAAGDDIDGNILLPQAISVAKSISLNYNQNVFAIEFAALDYFDADKVKYEYKLEGFNKDWLPIDGKARKAAFTNLDQGSYTFKVRTAGEDNIWVDSGNALTITIRPPFWKTPFAYFTYLLLVVCILYLLRRTELKKNKKDFAIEQERRDAKQMHEMDLVKIKFFTNVSHEFRTPLALILAPVEKMMKQAGGGQKNQLNLIYSNAKRLLNMVNQLLDFRKMEEKELKLQTTRGDIVRYINGVAHFFSDVADKKNISFSFHTNIDVFVTDFDEDKIERILFNLLSNAFKFSYENGHVAVEIDAIITEQHTYDFQIKVIDNGIGIAADKQEKIFERFFQNDVPGFMVNQGSGIGLAITKEFVKLHGGKITVQSEPDKGSCFIVHLKLVKEDSAFVEADAQSLSEIPQKDSPSPNTVVDAMNDLPVAQKQHGKLVKKPIVLLVEDNEDFRFYLKENFLEHFNIIEAGNGKQGWQKALAAHPDLVVSDISMPEMDGIDLCKKMKADKRTNHIPVILLTALTGEEQQLKGLETGANDYMTKPFNFDILLSKIKNQLNQQQQAKTTYQTQVTVNPSEVKTESQKDKFMQEILELIEKNMSEPEFSVEDMSKEMYMSRVALYKKLLQFTGKSPLEFLRQVRLKRAAQLLEKTNMTVAEVAYEVGFNNPKYFSKYFKEEYDKLPSVYAEEMRKV